MRIASIGAVYLDINVPHFSIPKDANTLINTETVGTEYEMALGGSAVNFARFCQKLNLQTSFVGKTGEDEVGRLVESLFRHESIMPALATDNTKQTNMNTNLISNDDHSIMFSFGNANQSLVEKDIMDQLHQHISQIDCLYIGGAFKLKNLISSLCSIVDFVKAKKKIAILDHGRLVNNVLEDEKNIMKKLAISVDFYLPSKDEFLDLWQVPSIDDAMNVFKDSKIVVVKDGNNGAFGLINGAFRHFPAFNVIPVNTVGAGDCFNAALISSIAKGNSLGNAITFANAAAALKISQTIFPTLEQIANLTKTQQNG